MMYATLATQAALIASIMVFSGSPATPAPAHRTPALQTAAATPIRAPLHCRLYFGCAPVAPAPSAQN